jgi:hypothetical protein
MIIIDLSQPEESKKQEVIRMKAMFEPVEGESLIRIADLKLVWAKTHWVPQFKRKETCPGADCPMCALGDKPRDRYYVRVINRKTNQPMIWGIANSEKSKIEAVYKSLLNDGRQIVDVDLKVMRNGKEKETVYNLIPSSRLVPPDEEAKVQDLIRNYSLDISKIIKVHTPAELTAMLEGKK